MFGNINRQNKLVKLVILRIWKVPWHLDREICMFQWYVCLEGEVPLGLVGAMRAGELGLHPALVAQVTYHDWPSLVYLAATLAAEPFLPWLQHRHKPLICNYHTVGSRIYKYYLCMNSFLLWHPYVSRPSISLLLISVHLTSYSISTLLFSVYQSSAQAHGLGRE